MAVIIEDAATVLEGFIHDVANLPAEIAHLLEEIQAKDQMIQECRNLINSRDTALQKHMRANGAITKHPKEEQYAKIILANYDKAQELQDQKVTLSQKAAFLLDRHVKRFDLKIRDLESSGHLLPDSQMPSLLSDSPANLVGPASTTGTGANTPLLPLGLGAGGSTNIANAAMARMANTAALGNRQNIVAPIAGMQPSPLSITSAARETSVGAPNDSKRRRIQSTLGTIAIPASGLRQSSLGPGTPRQGTPTSRAGSAGPRTKKPLKQVAPHHAQNMRKKLGKGGISKKSASRRLAGAGTKLSPSTTDNDEVSGSEASGSDEDVITVGPGHNDGAADDDVAMDEGGYEDEGDDNKLYCICHSVSHGNMVACDNENCPYEWFHWECVGMTQEPKGRWLCTECRKLPANQVKLAR